jgi:hypothetical protein
MRLTALLSLGFGRNLRCVDAGGGYGVLTRLMRDIGFEFFWSDPFCANLFAKGFEADHEGGSFPMVTAFEVMEHLHDPVTFVRDAMARYDGSAFAFSTQLFEGAPPPLDWPYYSFETGQHISFYQPRTLRRIAETLGMRHYTNRHFHLITKRPLSPTLFRLCASRAAFALFPVLKLRLASKTWPDRQRAMAELRAKGSASQSSGELTSADARWT